MQIRPSGLRVKPGTYFPALVAITQTSIVGKRKRFLTPRECARLQSFPDTFQYDEKRAQAYKQFGNSINVGLVSFFARYMFGDKNLQHKYSLEVQFPQIIKEQTLSLFPEWNTKKALQ
jgi:DNA (cytosine-5)-methyltransferase 1